MLAHIPYGKGARLIFPPGKINLAPFQALAPAWMPLLTLCVGISAHAVELVEVLGLHGVESGSGDAQQEPGNRLGFCLGANPGTVYLFLLIGPRVN